MRFLIAIAVGLGLASSAYAAAATISLTNVPYLGAGGSVVEACEASVDVDFTTSYVDGTGYVIDSVDLSFPGAGCDGLEVEVTLTEDSGGGFPGDSIGSGTDTITAGAASVAFGSTLVEDVDDVHVIVEP